MPNGLKETRKDVRPKNEMFMRRLQRAMYEKGLTRTKLAKQLHLHQSTVACWVSGKSLPHPAHLKKLSQVLEIPPPELVDMLMPAEPVAAPAK